MVSAAGRKGGIAMKRNPYGWDYPPGTEFHPDAPWNEVPQDCDIDIDADKDVLVRCQRCGSERYPGHRNPPAFVTIKCPDCGKITKHRRVLR